MADRSSFGFETTAEEVLEGIDLTGRRALVTGASGGLGAETARVLAGAGAAVTLAARDVAKARGVADAIRSESPGAELDVMEIELHRPESVRRFAKDWLARHPMLHVLVNNAGVMACPLARTPEGWEMQFATCHLGHFLLTALLVPALRAGAPARIVNVSSAGHRFGPVRLGDPHFEREPYDKWMAYGQAKTANVLHAVELDRRLAASGVRAFAIHPGAIITELGRRHEVQARGGRGGDPGVRGHGAGAPEHGWPLPRGRARGRHAHRRRRRPGLQALGGGPGGGRGSLVAERGAAGRALSALSRPGRVRAPGGPDNAARPTREIRDGVVSPWAPAGRPPSGRPLWSASTGA
jgi:NAD(P)-dependent dehydrogenase (short-subunit alcohol dehydrogenase family)